MSLEDQQHSLVLSLGHKWLAKPENKEHNHGFVAVILLGMEVMEHDTNGL